MTFVRTLRLCMIFMLSGVTAGAQPAPEQSTQVAADLAIVGVQVVDVRTGESRPGMTVAIEGDRIRTVSPSGALEVDLAATVIDGGGLWLIPGLWDAHVHTLWHTSLSETFLRLFVANGVTGVRDMGGVEEIAADWPRRIESGELFGPRMVTPGPILDGDPPLHAEVSMAVSNPEAGRQAVRTIQDKGFAFAKVYTLLERDAYFAIADEARGLGFPFAGHPSGYVTPIEASEAGQRSIEHLAHGQPDSGSLDLACVEEDDCEELLSTFARNGTWQVPTMVLLRAKAYSEEASYVEDERLGYMPPMVVADYLGARERRMAEATEERLTQRRLDWERHLKLVGLMARKGVPIAAGTDTGVLFSLPGFSLHDELGLLVEAGLTPAEALRAATIEVAALVGLSGSVGEIRAGQAADLVLLRANPLEAIDATREIEAVIRAGQYLDRTQLDELLAEARLAAAPE